MPPSQGGEASSILVSRSQSCEGPSARSQDIVTVQSMMFWIEDVVTVKKVILLTILGLFFLLSGSLLVILQIANVLQVHAAVLVVVIVGILASAVLLYKVGRIDIYTTKFKQDVVQPEGKAVAGGVLDKNKRLIAEYKITADAKSNLKDLKIPENSQK